MAETRLLEYCDSCGLRLTKPGFVTFSCPECGTMIGRCSRCRHQGNMYVCKTCGFQGP